MCSPSADGDGQGISEQATTAVPNASSNCGCGGIVKIVPSDVDVSLWNSFITCLPSELLKLVTKVQSSIPLQMDADYWLSSDVGISMTDTWRT